MTASATSRDSALALLREFGTEAMSFLALEPEMQLWFSEGPHPRACVAYVDTGSAWVAAGAPIAEPSNRSAAANAFVRDARAAGRRACFFGIEQPELEGFAHLLLGEQPSWNPAEWPDIVARHRRVREQLRRAAAKGVRVRKVLASDLSPGSVLRVACEALAREWLAFRPMPPMRFVVALEPFVFADEHRYFVAERGDDVVAFLSAVPVYATRGWLVEDLPRSRRAPNGSIEMLIDAMMRDAASESVSPYVSPYVTMGLAPLTGPVSTAFRLARFVGRPLYDFRGLRSFKERLRPSSWQSVWLAFPRSEMAALHVVESLRAFAGGSLVGFGLRTLGMLGLHPSGPPWALAVPLVPWTLLLAVVAFSGRADLLGYSAGVLLAWVVFDALLFAQLIRSAARPRPRRLLGSDVLAVVDAALSLHHLAVAGFGNTAVASTLRGVATFAPCMGAVVLTWATAQAAQRARETRYSQATRMTISS
jgi:phosphatidylglycerol lysyltransferase